MFVLLKYDAFTEDSTALPRKPRATHPSHNVSFTEMLRFTFSS